MDMMLYLVFIIAIIITIMSYSARLILGSRLVGYSIRIYIKEVVIPILKVSFLSILLLIVLKLFILDRIDILGLVILLEVISTLFLIYMVGLSRVERNKFCSVIKEKLK